MSTSAPHRPVDLVAGVAAVAAETTARTARRLGHAGGPAVRWVLDPPVVPRGLRPGRLLERVARLGSERRDGWSRELSDRVDVLLPLVLGEVLRRGRVAELLVRYVDLDAVVAAVDLDAAAARLDVDTVVARADVDEVVSKVDVDAIVARVDVDAVAQRLDLDAVLDRLNLTQVVLERVDLGLLVDEILTRVDLVGLAEQVIDGVDLVGLAEQVIDGVDLPEIIRESTGSMASDTVRGVRMQGIAADEAVGRAMDRLLLRRGRRGGVASAGEPAVPAQPDRSP